MIYSDGNTTGQSQSAKVELSPETLEMLANLMASKIGSMGRVLPGGVAEEEANPETLAKLAAAMTKTDKVKDKNFDKLGKKQEVEGDKSNQSTIDILKNL